MENTHPDRLTQPQEITITQHIEYHTSQLKLGTIEVFRCNNRRPYRMSQAFRSQSKIVLATLKAVGFYVEATRFINKLDHQASTTENIKIENL